MGNAQKSTMNKGIKSWPLRLAEADMVFWLMPPLIILLIIGTVSQRWIGLYEAHHTYFSSFVIWAGPVPLPGGYIILGLLALNLTAKFLFKSEWSWRKSGIILAHLGTLILLIGGLITSIMAEERYMVIPEGGNTPFIYHYTKRNLMIFEGEGDTEREIMRMPYSKIDQWNTGDLPFKIDLKFACDNCQIIKREDSDDHKEDELYGGMAQFMALTQKPREKEPEANLTGFEFNITGSDQDGNYLAFDGMPKAIEITSNDKNYAIIFGKDQSVLPFSITLKDFVKDDYEATSMARGYHSDIVINDGDLEWETRIEMNKPLRYKGYTFFQSSFDQSENGELTILSVVKNSGWLFPYIGTIILGVGLLLHIIITFSNHTYRRRT